MVLNYRIDPEIQSPKGRLLARNHFHFFYLPIVLVVVLDLPWVPWNDAPAVRKRDRWDYIEALSLRNEIENENDDEDESDCFGGVISKVRGSMHQ